MAKIDTSQIEGYAGMTAEEKLAALESFEIADPDYTGYVKKEQFDKAAKDAADWKKKYNSKLSEDDQAAQAQKDLMEQMETELNALRYEKKVSDYTAKFAAAGYDAELAKSTAAALADGDMEKVFANQAKFQKAYEKSLRAELMKETPKPDGAGGSEDFDKVKTKEDFLKLTTEQQIAYVAEHPKWKDELK